MPAKKHPVRSPAPHWTYDRGTYDRDVDKGPQAMEEFEHEPINAEIAQKICDLRTKAGLSQRELARRVGTTASVICRLEDADYEGHTLGAVRRIATALNRRLELRAVPIKAASARTRPAERSHR